MQAILFGGADQVSVHIARQWRSHLWRPLQLHLHRYGWAGAFLCSPCKCYFLLLTWPWACKKKKKKVFLHSPLLEARKSLPDWPKQESTSLPYIYTPTAALCECPIRIIAGECLQWFLCLWWISSPYLNPYWEQKEMLVSVTCVHISA